MSGNRRGWTGWTADWGGFIRSATRAESLVFLLLTAGLLAASYVAQDDWISVMLGGVAAVAAGALGAFWAQSRTEERAQERLKMRAEAAVGSLKVLHIALMKLKARLGHHSQSKLEGPNGASVKSALEELEGQVAVLGEQVINAIENWANVTDRADVRSIIGEINALEQKLNETSGLLEHAKKTSANRDEAHAKEIKRLTDEKQSLEDRLRQKSVSSGLLTLSGPLDTALFMGMNARACAICGKLFHTSPLEDLMIIPVCPDCRKSSKGPASSAA